MISTQTTRRTSPAQEARREAKRLGIPWEVVQSAYKALQEQEQIARERSDDIRQTAWQLVTASTPGCWPFWRHGFTARWGKKYAEADQTVVPGYDELHDSLARQFPEFSGPDGEDRLFQFLFSTYERRTAPAQLWQEAIAWALDEQARYTDCPGEDDAIPF